MTYNVFSGTLNPAQSIKTWGNRKPGNCVFWLKCCMVFQQRTWNTVKNITWSEL